MGKAMALTLAAILSLTIFTYMDVKADSQVQITGHRMSVDSGGIVHISGMVENKSADAIGFVRITANLFDANGKKLPTYSTYALLRTVPPGYISPFDMPISNSEVGNSISSYTLSLEWRTVQHKADKLEFSDLNAFVWTHVDPRTKEFRNPHGSNANAHHFSHAHSEITAVIKNAGDLTKNVRVFVIWYDERGQYYSYDMQSIAQKMTSLDDRRFVIMTHPAMGYYSLVAESEDYVSMLTESGDRMFRLYEANADNRALPGVDTMSITDVVVKDVVGNIIDTIPLKNKPVLPHFKSSASNNVNSIIADGGKEYNVQVRTYANEFVDLEYDHTTRTMTVTAKPAENDFVHAEIIIPNTFTEFLSVETFEATYNGVVLHQKSFLVDPYSYEGKTAMHYIISGDDLKQFSQQMTEAYEDHLVLTLRSLDSKIISVNAGEPVQVQSTITNNIDKRQKFVYILQLKNSAGTTAMISWMDSTIFSKESVNTLLSWTPAQPGTYTMQIFLWESLIYPSTMSSNFASTTFVVS